MFAYTSLMFCHMHTYIYDASTHKYIYRFMHVCLHTYKCTYTTHVCLHTYGCTYIHTPYTKHVCQHIYLHVDSCIWAQSTT